MAEQQVEEVQITTDVDLFKKLDDVTKRFNEAMSKSRELAADILARQQTLERALIEKADEVRWSRFRPEYLRQFVEEPYVIEPFRIDKGGQVLEWKVYVPKMVEFHVGRLERATHSYNVFVVNQYMRWFAEIPQELSDRFPEVEIELKVEDGMLLAPAEQTDRTFEKYRKFLYKKVGPGRLQVKKGSEWELIAQILEDGCLPFTPKAVDPDDVRQNSKGGYALNEKWEMRDYQKQAMDTFMEYGAIGIYWPFGTGKSQFGLELCDRLKGPKLIIAGGSRALKEQWEERLKAMPPARRAECNVVVYQSSNEINNLAKKLKEFTLIIFDECLPYEEQVYTEYGPIPIGYLVENQIRCNVWSYNFNTNQMELKPITHHFKKQASSLLEVETKYSHVRVTPTHEIYLSTGKHLPARLLQVGDLNVSLRNMWQGVREKAVLRGSYDASQASRAQQTGFSEPPLEPREAPGMGCLQGEAVTGPSTIWEPVLERGFPPTNMEENSLRGLSTSKGMYGLPRAVGGHSVRYPSQGWGSIKQHSGKHHGALPFLSREPTPRGWGHYTEVDNIRRVREIEVNDPRVYDIEVADNHNFFANSILVSNCHHLPAKTFMRLSTIPTKYRLGLTGSPYREDGHINYIMALTGYPHGLSWDKFVIEGIITLAQVQVHVVKKDRYKLSILDALLQRDLGKTLIFCDSLDLGESLGKKYSIPWIYGATKDRMDKIQRNERVVISRVGDEGISIPELDTVIEVDFLGGSRAQALQRVGRLQHRALDASKEPAVHHILMTEEEVEKYGKRVLAYYDKGYKVDWLYDM